jgi:hypothetical protein
MSGLAYMMAACREYSRERGIERPTDLVDFSDWCEINCPPLAEELEKMAADVLNGRTLTESGGKEQTNLS